MDTGCPQQLTFWKLGKQQVTATSKGGKVVSDAGLLPLRNFERRLGLIADLARRLPDPRAQPLVKHVQEAILTQQIFQILAGYPDGNDAQALRGDPLFQTLVGSPPDKDRLLASRSTLIRHQNSYTRRDAELPLEERPALLDMRAAQVARIKILNELLVDWFIRTRTQPPAHVIIDLDATDDPTHGQQLLAGFHGYFDQHQYFPLLAFDGDSGFPLAAWLRPGTVHASCGTVDTLKLIVHKLRAAWPNLTILVRADTGFAIPDIYEYCEAEGLLYCFGYGTNDVLKDRTAAALADLELYYALYGQREEHVQRFETFDDYQAGGWSRPRRILAKIEINRHGLNRRFCVTNMSGHPQGIYHGFYVQRGDVPERPIGDLKNGLNADRLSCHHFTANSFRLLEHVVAYALVVLFREATAAIAEVANARISTLRQHLWKVGALVQTSVRRIWFHFSETWPHWELLTRIEAALVAFVERLRRVAAGNSDAPLLLM